MTWAKKPPRERRVLFEIVKVRRNKPLYEQLSPAQQKNLTEFLRGVHGRLRLWQKCKKRVCRRRRRCCGEVNACGAALSHQHWKWIRHFVEALREGVTRGAAVRAADKGMIPRRVLVPGIAEPSWFLEDDDGMWVPERIAPPPFRFGNELKRLARRFDLQAAE
jgi:hypothetical protein